MEIDKVEKIMKLMKTFKVTNLKLDGLEMSMPPEYETVADEDNISDEDLLFYSNGENT